ncbi:MAG: class I SAM-dependent methyltransferase [Calditrichaceae bacterium]
MENGPVKSKTAAKDHTPPQTRVRYLSPPDTFLTYEEKYLKLRKKEGRIYTDEIVRLLPEIGKKHPYYSEWKIRAESFRQLKSYLSQRGNGLTILEIGCGNGWLARRLTALPKSTVYGLDVNSIELEQAARVSGSNPQIHFVYGNIFDDIFQSERFDIILLASSVQYFPDLKALMGRLFRILAPKGEIHIIDSPVYDSGEIIKARERSFAYYKDIGFPDLAGLYFHHSFDDLISFNHRVLFNPGRLSNRIFGIIRRPFPWIAIDQGE